MARPDHDVLDLVHDIVLALELRSWEQWIPMLMQGGGGATGG